MWRIERYRPEMKEIWDSFVDGSRNSTFLFRRDYMDYHSDRFADCSWVVWNDSRLMALLPANLTEDGILHSHQGLTYGGWILPPNHLDGSMLLEIFNEAIAVWRREGIKALDYKPLPWIYADRPSQEDIYALWRLGADLSACLLSSTLDMSEGLRLNTLRRRTLRKAEKTEAEIRQIENAEEIMALVDACLAERYGARAVHSSAEMRRLMATFPDHIKAYGAYLPDQAPGPQAGVVLYDCGQTVHTQYIATTTAGRESNLLTLLFCRLIESGMFTQNRYFDFGTSNEEGGHYLNAGLLRQKYSFGATGVAYTRWHLDFNSLPCFSALRASDREIG